MYWRVRLRFLTERPKFENESKNWYKPEIEVYPMEGVISSPVIPKVLDINGVVSRDVSCVGCTSQTKVFSPSLTLFSPSFF